jgi:hypothetical protein
LRGSFYFPLAKVPDTSNNRFEVNQVPKTCALHSLRGPTTMWTSLALAAGLLTVLPGAAQKPKNEDETKPPKILHARFLYTGLGMERPSKFLPGDDLVMAFDIENLYRDKKTGKVVFGMVLEFIDSKDKRIFRTENRNLEELNALGGRSFATFVSGQVGRDTKPGMYTLRLTFTDRITRKKTVFTKKFEVLKKAFGILRVQTPAVGFAGQPFGIKFSVEGFERDDKKIPHLTMRLRLYDDKDKPTLVRPIDLYIPKDLDEDVDASKLPSFDLGVGIRLTRPGIFTANLIATDHLAKKTVQIPYKITVLDPRKYESSK